MTESNALLPSEIQEAIARYRPYLLPADYEELLAAANRAAPSAVRVNLLKSTDPKRDLEAWSERYGWQTAPVAFSSCSWQVLSSQTHSRSNARTPPGY